MNSMPFRQLKSFFKILIGVQYEFSYCFFRENQVYYGHNHLNTGGISMEQETNLPEEEETGILTLTDENGQDANFEYLDCIEYQDTEYLVLMPEGEDEIVILEVEPVDEDNENYLAVEDEETLNAVYEIFKEKFKDVLTFEE